MDATKPYLESSDARFLHTDHAAFVFFDLEDVQRECNMILQLLPKAEKTRLKKTIDYQGLLAALALDFPADASEHAQRLSSVLRARLGQLQPDHCYWLRERILWVILRCAQLALASKFGQKKECVFAVSPLFNLRMSEWVLGLIRPAVVGYELFDLNDPAFEARVVKSGKEKRKNR